LTESCAILRDARLAKSEAEERPCAHK
jgi:hypothetical protein